jgi:hypothetical protein
MYTSKSLRDLNKYPNNSLQRLRKARTNKTKLLGEKL